jgi:hypothetical protein
LRVSNTCPIRCPKPSRPLWVRVADSEVSRDIAEKLSGYRARVFGIGARLVFVAEIKSVTGANEEGQMRLRLGQVLHYAHQLSKKLSGVKVVPVLVPEREPSDPEWRVLCTALGVIMTWPADFSIAIGGGDSEFE